MEIGKIAVLRKNKSVLVEVKKISDEDIATVEMCAGGAVFKIQLSELEEIGAVQCHREAEREVHILGTQYKILIIPEGDYRFSRDADGWVDTSSKEILIFNFLQSVESVRDLEAYQRKVLRHEIVHAFLYESGLWQNAYGCKCWAKNEEMVDWIAIQYPKLREAFKEAGCDEE